MKLLGPLLTVVFLSQGAFAKVYEISCSAPDIAPLHKFAGQGLIATTDDVKFVGQLELTLQEPGYEGAITQVAVHKIEGDFKVIAAGDLTAEEIKSAAAKASEIEKQTYQFLFDVKIPAASKAIINQRQYKSNCTLKLSSN